jgi:hypothetical protein
MKTTTCLLSLTIICGMAALRVSAADAPATAAPKVPEGWLLIEEDVWYQLADEPDRHFLQARLHYLQKDHEAAAADIRKAAAVLKLATSMSEGDAKKALQGSIFELEVLAAEAKAGKVRSTRTLDRIFARAYEALAAHNSTRAMEFLRNDDANRAAFHLRAAARDIDHAYAWAGVEAGDGAVAALRSAEELGRKLLEGAANAVRDALKAGAALHEELEDLKKALEAAK